MARVRLHRPPRIPTNTQPWPTWDWPRRPPAPIYNWNAVHEPILSASMTRIDRVLKQVWNKDAIEAQLRPAIWGDTRSVYQKAHDHWLLNYGDHTGQQFVTENCSFTHSGAIPYP